MDLGKGRVGAVLVALALGVAACGGSSGTTGVVLETVSPAEASAIIEGDPEGLLILDVRSAEDYAQAHLPGAANADVRAEDFRDRIATLDRDAPYVVYCREGNWSQDALEVMEDLGFAEVYGIDGGIIAWVEESFPIVLPQAASVETVAPAEAFAVVQAAPEGLIILDVRLPEEFAEARIPGAVNIDSYAEGFVNRLAQLDRTTPYVLYCRSGNRSGSVVPIMEDLGFQEVYDVDGGIVAWSEAGLPLEFP